LSFDIFFFSSRRRHTRSKRDWSSDVCSSDLKTCEQFYRNFGLYEKSPNSFLPGLPRSIINQLCFHNFLCLRLASVHLPHPFHLVFSFQLLCHAVLLCQLWHDQLHAASCRFVNLGAMLKELVG